MSHIQSLLYFRFSLDSFFLSFRRTTHFSRFVDAPSFAQGLRNRIFVHWQWAMQVRLTKQMKHVWNWKTTTIYGRSKNYFPSAFGSILSSFSRACLYWHWPFTASIIVALTYSLKGSLDKKLYAEDIMSTMKGNNAIHPCQDEFDSYRACITVDYTLQCKPDILRVYSICLLFTYST